MDICLVDTSALIADTDLFKKLFFCRIIIHTIVLEELSDLCNKKGVKGVNARKIKNQLFKLRNRGDFFEGIRVKHNIIQFDDRKPDAKTYLRYGFDPNNKDNLLFCVAKEIEEESNQKVTLYTGDKFFLLKTSCDIKIEHIKQNQKAKKKRRPKNKGYYNKGHELAMKRV